MMQAVALAGTPDFSLCVLRSPRCNYSLHHSNMQHNLYVQRHDAQCMHLTSVGIMYNVFPVLRALQQSRPAMHVALKYRVEKLVGCDIDAMKVKKAPVHWQNTARRLQDRPDLQRAVLSVQPDFREGSIEQVSNTWPTSGFLQPCSLFHHHWMLGCGLSKPFAWTPAGDGSGRSNTRVRFLGGLGSRQQACTRKTVPYECNC